MAIGIAMPKAETRPMALPWRQTVERSTSSPTTSSSSVADMMMKPSSAIATGAPGMIGNSQRYASGAMPPKTVEPSRTPARISPSTAGCPSWRAISPMKRAKPSRTAMARSSRVICETSRPPAARRA